MLDIKNIEGKVVFSTPINKGCKRKYTLMQENYISLVFNVAEPIYFRLGDNIYDGQFEITDLVSPHYNDSTAGYEYEVKFDAYYWKWKNKKFFYAPEFGAREASWSLTANLDTQLSIVIRNLNHLNYTYKGTAFEFSVDSTVKNVSKPLRYDNLSIIEALNLMAQTWECEWWVTDNIIHLGRCEYGTPVDFELNNNVEKMSRNEGKRTFATRVYAVGSERNITRKYRPVDSSITTNGIVQKRLTLPIDTPYIDAFPDMTQEEAVEQIVIFDDVYPKLISKVSNVEVKESSVKDKETQVVSKLWTYFISDDSLKFDKKYILPDAELRLVFQSGALNGLDFAVGFANNRFEIIRNEEYGRLLPDDILKPKVGDEFVLYGYDTEFVSDALLPKAEQELKERAIEFVEKSKIDPSTYECHMMSDYMRNGGKVRTFEVGDRVRLINKAYFKDSRVSRIIGYEHPLDRPYDSPTYLVGETASYSHLEEIKADVKELTYKEKTFSGSGSNVYVIGQYDSTPPTDRNTLSSQKSLNTFHRKDQTDETDHLQKYNKGIEVGGFIDSMSHGKGAGIDEHGNAQFESVEVRSYFKVLELIYNKLQGVESDFVFSASATIEKVEKTTNGYRLTFRKKYNNDIIGFQKGDVLRGIVNSLDRGEGFTSWLRVEDITNNVANVILYPDAETPAKKNFIPTSLMVLQHWGNAINRKRQSTWYISSEEGRIVFLDGVTKPILSDNNYSGFWGKPIQLQKFKNLPLNLDKPYIYVNGVIAQDFILLDYEGNPVVTVEDIGIWTSNKEYKDGKSSPYIQHDVWYDGSRFRCVLDNKNNIPSENSPYWILIQRKPLEGKKGDKGDKGATGAKGDRGPVGSQGIPGTSSYFHVKYSANASGSPMVDTPNTYIGTSVTESELAPSDYKAYTWVRLEGVQGVKGDKGIAGPKGADGRTSYLHIKYSDDGKTFTSNSGETPGAYIGQYTDFVEADSNDFSKYTWTKIKGDKGATGAKGDKGDRGIQGVQGLPGMDGPSTYPAGEWSEYTTYERTDFWSPIVYYSGLFYLLKKKGTTSGLPTPKDDYAKNGKNANWQLANQYELLLVNAAIIKYGQIGASVFFDEFTYSQYGLTSKGVQTNNYKEFKTGDFTPNFLINWKTGDFFSRNGVMNNATMRNCYVGGLLIEQTNNVVGSIFLPGAKIDINKGLNVNLFIKNKYPVPNYYYLSDSISNKLLGCRVRLQKYGETAEYSPEYEGGWTNGNNLEVTPIQGIVKFPRTTEISSTVEALALPDKGYIEVTPIKRSDIVVLYPEGQEPPYGERESVVAWEISDISRQAEPYYNTLIVTDSKAELNGYSFNLDVENGVYIIPALYLDTFPITSVLFHNSVKDLRYKFKSNITGRFLELYNRNDPNVKIMHQGGLRNLEVYRNGNISQISKDKWLIYVRNRD